jgi:hypothetical protein
VNPWFLPQVKEIEEGVEYVFLSDALRGYSFFKEEFQVFYTVFEAFEFHLAFSWVEG